MQHVFEIEPLLLGVIPSGDDECRFCYQKFERAIQSIIKTKIGDENSLMAESMDNASCPTFILAMKGSYAHGEPYLFRSYQRKLSEPSDCKIWQVARASTAAPSFFKPLCISDSSTGTFVDGGYAYYNPSNFALSEARTLWPTVREFCLVSMGQGKPSSGADREKSVYDPTLFNDVVLPLIPHATLTPKRPGEFTVQKLIEIFEISAKRKDYVHQQMLEKANDNEEGILYYRFAAGGDVHDIGLHEWQQLGEVEARVSLYITEDGKRKLDECVQNLLDPAAAQGAFKFSSWN